MSWRIFRKYAFWVRRKAEISEGLLMHERQIKSETSSELVPFSPHPWSKLRLPYKSIHYVTMLPKTPRSNPEACGTHLWVPLRGQQEALLSGRTTVPNTTTHCAASQHRLEALSPELRKKGVIGKSEQTSPASLSDRGLPSSMIPPLKQ